MEVKLSWTGLTVISIRLGATLGDDHGDVERWKSELDNATMLGAHRGLWLGLW